MEVIIHGTKGGYRVLFQTEGMPHSFASDVRRIDKNDGTPVGQSVYSISFLDTGYVYSKYIIVRDTERKAVGNVGFSVYLKNNEKLPSDLLKKVLDELAGWYRSNYIIDGSIGNKNEDWIAVTVLINNFKSKLKTDKYSVNMSGGIKDAAYIYYSNQEELLEYLDIPYQEEYKTFKQVFLIEKCLENLPENPLNALRHDEDANLSGLINFDKLRLINFEGKGKNGISIELFSSNRKLQNYDTLDIEQDITIKYTKEFYKSIEVRGNVKRLDETKHLKIDNKTLKINSDNDIKLQPEIKEFTLYIQDEIGNYLKSAKVSCSNDRKKEKDIINGKLHFQGKELGQEWMISIEEDNYYSKRKPFKPESIEGNSITLQLKEQKEISFEVLDFSNKLLNNYIIKINGKTQYDEIILFEEEELSQKFTISVSHQDYETFEDENFFPEKNDAIINVRLEKKNDSSKKTDTQETLGTAKSPVKENTQYYAIDAGEHGKLIEEKPGFSEYKDGRDVLDSIESDKGWKFTSYKLTEDKLIAQYKENIPWYKKWISTSTLFIGIIVITLILAIIFLVIFLNPSVENDDTTHAETLKEIIEYSIGTDIDKSKIEEYKIAIKNITIKKNSAEINSQKKLAESNIKNVEIILEFQEVNSIQSYARGQKIYNLIQEGAITELRNLTMVDNPSKESNENKFLKALKNIEDKELTILKSDISKILKIPINGKNDLNGWAEKINDEIVKYRESIAEKEEPSKPDGNLSQGSNGVEIPTKLPNPDKEKIERIVKEFEAKFWELFKTRNKKMDDYVDLFNSYKTTVPYDNEVKIFLSKIVAGLNEFNQFIQIPEVQKERAEKSKSVKELINLF